MSTNLPKIRLSADYGLTVIWHASGDNFGPISASELPISEDLRQTIENWALAYDKTLNDDDPLSSGFESKEDEDRFLQQGQRIHDRLCHELKGVYEVEYKE